MTGSPVDSSPNAAMRAPQRVPASSRSVSSGRRRPRHSLRVDEADPNGPKPFTEMAEITMHALSQFRAHLQEIPVVSGRKADFEVESTIGV